MIGQRLAHHEIIEKLGEGGMGVVYKARDTHLDRFVALKLLPPEKVADPERKRLFVREAKAASALNHPNIIIIHDIDQAGGIDFMAMEYISGNTLAKCIASGLTQKEAVKYAIQITDALAASHAVGIIHRDLKPANVMVTAAGLVKVLDFGLAKLTEPVAGEADSTATALAGTVPYMSPEQAEGRKVDARSDIFSFGAVLYEMLSGRRAFSGLLREPPAPLSGDLPAGLEPIILRCLRRNPEERYQNAAELKLALEHVGPASAPLPSIAVLPFANLSADKENEYFGDGLAEDIIDALAKLPGLRVIARTSAFAFRGKDADVGEIAAKLRVGHVLEGSVRKAGSRIRVAAQLINTADQSHLWSERYEHDMTDVFAIQDGISRAIVDNLRVRLAPDRPLVKRPTENLEAHNLYRRGMHSIYRVTPQSLARGKEYLEQAIALEPNYALAYAGLALYHGASASVGLMAGSEALPQCKAAALTALKLDDTLAEAHAMAGLARAMCDFDWVGAEQEFRRALELNPASGIPHLHYAIHYLRPMGRLEEALVEVRRALDIDPLSVPFNIFLGHLYDITGQHDLAMAQYQNALELDPSWIWPHVYLAIAFLRTGRFEEAIAAAQKACALSGRSAMPLAILAGVYGHAGRQGEARALLEELTALRRTTYVQPFAMVMAHRGLFESDRVLEWMDKGIEERDEHIICALKCNPTFDPLRNHPRFQAMLRRINLE
jgi:TolB-like protein/Flp pilus assembly protein TadD